MGGREWVGFDPGPWELDVCVCLSSKTEKERWGANMCFAETGMENTKSPKSVRDTENDFF